MRAPLPAWEEVDAERGGLRCWTLAWWRVGGCWYEVTYRQRCVSVACYPDDREPPAWVDVIRVSERERVAIGRMEPVASKYIQAARARQSSGGSALTCDDKYLFGSRPALAEFMTLLADDEGEVREASVLMVCPKPDGFSVGLKDDDAGGWLWKTGDTLAKALDAIEKALQGGEARFSSRDSRAGRKTAARG